MEYDDDNIRIVKLEKKMDTLSDKYNDMAISQASANEKLNCVLSTLDDLKKAINEIQNLPARRWDILMGAVISSIAAIIAGYLIGKFI